MRSKFNKSWNRSIQPRKQVKFRANAPNHIKRKFMASPLDKPLREKYGRRCIEVRKGDEVKVMRGKFAKKLGKVGIVDVAHTRIQIDGLQRAKKGGEKLETWFHPTIDVQRGNEALKSHIEAFSESKDKKIIQKGDLLHCDFGITYIGLNTDCQQHAYILKDDENDSIFY